MVYRSKKNLRVLAGPEALEARCLMAAVPAGFHDLPVAVGLARPTTFTMTPDGRVLVAEQAGNVRVIENGTLLAEPLIRLSVDTISERGLVGITVDPNFETNGYLYVHYTTSPLDTVNIRNRVSRLTVVGNVADPSTERVLIELDPQIDTFHNGGAIHFGVDGKLYIATGDNARKEEAQSLGNLLGKMLRINSDGTIPQDNPFFHQTSGKNRAIWALGLRNPFTFAVQPGTGRIYINDVGQRGWEEINQGSPGANYGWPITEGPTNDPRFDSPVFAYRHDGGDPHGCAIVGGAFYNPQSVTFPSKYVGDYFFADFCAGAIWNYDRATDHAERFATGIQYVTKPVDLLVSSDGDVYYLTLGDGGNEVGTVRRITANEAPVVQLPGIRTYRENGAPLPVSPQAVVSDADSANFAGGQLRVKIAGGGQPGDRLSIRTGGHVSIAGDNVKVFGVAIGTISGGGSVELVVTLNAAATPARMQILLRNVAYHSVSENPATMSRAIVVRLSDGDGGASAAATARIRVEAVNDAPVLGGIGGTIGYPRNAAAVLLAASATVSDVDSANFAGGRLVVRVTSGGQASNLLVIGGGFTLQGDEIRRNGITIGTRNANGGVGTTNLVVTFNSSATVDVVQQLVRSLRFRTVGSASLGQRTITLRLSDGDGGASAEVTKNVNVIP